MIYNISTTSRTGYEPQTAGERVREAVAILVAIATVGVLAAAVSLASWYI